MIRRSSVRSNGRKKSELRRLGTAMIETAVVLPVFLTIVLGIVEFGRAMMVSQMVANASREGCRRAILDGSSNKSIKNDVADFLAATLSVKPGDVDVTFYVNDIEVDVKTAQESDKIKVHVDVPFDKVTFVGGSYLKGKKLVGETTMRHE